MLLKTTEMFPIRFFNSLIHVVGEDTNNGVSAKLCRWWGR